MKNGQLKLTIMCVLLLLVFAGCAQPVNTGFEAEADSSLSAGYALESFHLASTEVTYSLWYGVYTWAVGHGYQFANPGTEGGTNRTGLPPTAGKSYPVCNINWRDAIVWCNAYSEKSRLTPCYTNAAGVLRDSRDSNGPACDVTGCNFAVRGYRLPSVAEWEYVATNHGRTPGNYASGATADVWNATATKRVAWYTFNSTGGPSEVAKKAANARGKYDMSGNVWEWCWDVGNTNDHFLKGGCWYDDPPWLSIADPAFAYANQADYEYTGYGFRVGSYY